MKNKNSIKLFVLITLSITIFSCSNDESATEPDNFTEIVELKSQINVAGKDLDQTITTRVNFNKEGELISEEILSIQLGDQFIENSSSNDSWNFVFEPAEKSAEIFQPRSSVSGTDCDPAVVTRQTIFVQIPNFIQNPLAPTITVPVGCLTTTTQTCYEGGYNSDGVLVGRIVVSTTTSSSFGGC